MYKNHFIKVFGFILFCQLFSLSVTGQVRYAFLRDTIGIKGGETFANSLKVSNGYSHKVVLKNPEKGLKGMLSLPDSMVLLAGETKTFPVKYIADRQTIKSNIQAFSVNLVSMQGGLEVQKSAKFMTLLKNVGGLTIGTENDEIYLSQLSNQAQVVVRCANTGYVPVTFRLLLSGIPDGLEFTGQTMNLTLQPGSQQLLPFLARNKTSGRISPDFTVTIQALDDQNNQLAIKVIRIINVSSERRMNSGIGQFGGNAANSIALRYASLSNSTTIYQLQSNGSIELGKGATLKYQANADQYRQIDYNGLNIYNTFVDYQAKKWGVKLGNIYENLDLQLGGRGIKASAKFTNKGVLSIYGLDNNYMLFDQLSTNIPGAKIIAADYNLIRSVAQEQRVTAAHKHDTFTGLNADQVNFKSGFLLDKDQTLALEGGYSIEDKYNGPASPKHGGGGGLVYMINRDKYRLNFNSYYSTPYYTGLRRGLFLTDMRFLLKTAKTSGLTAHVSLQQSNAKFQAVINNQYNLLNLGINKNSVYIYELGYQKNAGQFNFGLAPYFMDQRLVSSAFQETTHAVTNWKSSSVRFNASLGYTGRIQSFSMNADYGYTYVNNAEKPPAPFHSLRVNMSYNLPIIGLTSYIQINPYYLSDVLSFNPGNPYHIYSFGPNVHFSALNNNLWMQFSGMYNYYGFTRNKNYSASGSLRYLLKGNWAITGDLQYTVTKQQVYTQFAAQEALPVNYPQDLIYNNRQLRVGIEKRFGGGHKGAGKLSLVYYEDRNSNGQRDADESAVPGVLVKINGEAALTNTKGEVEFREMKKGTYTASVTNTKGWSLQEPTDILLDKNKRIEVPLVKTQALNGCIKLTDTKYMDGIPPLAGIRINAADANGRVHQTMTNDRGEFCFYLPRNKYTVYIETEGMPFSIENGKEEVMLSGSPVGLLTFLYKDQRRKVGVTRF